MLFSAYSVSAYSVSEGGKTGKSPPLTLSFCAWPQAGAASTCWSSAFPRAASSPTDNWREPRACPAGLAPRAARWPPARAGKPYPGIASSPPAAVLSCANRSPPCSGGFLKAKASAWLTAASLSLSTYGRRRRDLRSDPRSDLKNWPRNAHRRNPQTKVALPAAAAGHPGEMRPPSWREALAAINECRTGLPLFSEKHPMFWVGPMKCSMKPTFPYRSFILLTLSLVTSVVASGCIGAARARVQANKPAPQQTFLSPFSLGIGPNSLARTSTRSFS
jgi:hypothetical protein